MWKKGDKVRFLDKEWEITTTSFGRWWLWPLPMETVGKEYLEIERSQEMFQTLTSRTFEEIANLCGGNNIGKQMPDFPDVQSLMKFVKRINELYDNACDKDKPATEEKSQSDTNETGDMTTITIPTKLCKKLQYLALIPDPENPYSKCRTYNEGKSDYSKHLIQAWTIWQDYPELDPWQKDIIKRTLRIKTKEDEILDTKKIIHICNERLRQLEYEK